MTTGAKQNIQLSTVYPLNVKLAKSLTKMRYSNRGQLLLASAAESLEKRVGHIVDCSPLHYW